MKVYIGKYRDYLGPYQLAEKLLFWLPRSQLGERHPWTEQLGDWFAGSGEEPNLLCRFLNWRYERVRRKVKIRIDSYDTWNMDHTLSLIIVPMLEQLRVTKHGSANVDDADVPEELRSGAGPAPYDFDPKLHYRWDYVLGEMIWAFQQVRDENAELQFFNDQTGEFDREGYDLMQKRISNGLTLFGKYYQGLWD